MSIRYRLLFIVGLVTSSVFLLTFFLNGKLLQQHLAQTQKEGLLLREKTSEMRRENVEILIRDAIAKKLAKINALLETVVQFPSLSDWFAPNPENLRMGTWGHAANFLQNEDWVQFIQNTSGNELLSLIAPETGAFFKTQEFPIEEGLAWIYVFGSEMYSEPHLGVQIPLKETENLLEEESDSKLSDDFPVSYVLYSLDQLKSLSFPANFLQDKDSLFSGASAQGYDLDVEKFFAFLVRATELVKNPEWKAPELKEQQPNDEGLVAVNAFHRLTQKYQEETLEYSSELFAIEEALALKPFHLFEEGLDAVTIIDPQTREGRIFFLKSVLGYSKPFFKDQEFFQKTPPSEGSSICSDSTIIKGPHPNQALLVNTAVLTSQLEGKVNQSLLTIGFDISDFLYNLSDTSEHYGCIINENEVLVQVVPSGMPSISFQDIPSLVTLSKSKMGVFSLGDIEYVYATMFPDPDRNCYFCFFLPKEVEFQYFTKVQKDIQEILRHLWVQRILLGICSLLVLWIVLLDLSKKITQPITALASSLRYVKYGEWDKIQIPEVHFNKNNEIRQLIVSFQDMIEGMKEKEKMSAVLNKVVSKEIAQEILKGDVHLGGEEKEVTMLFADIRGFTQLTQKMPPHDVIHLLNTCMTKLSQAIEGNKGVIDKYLGDGIMALYGAPVSYSDSPLCAVVSAMEMISTLQKWDEERVKLGEVSLNIGVGIHTGTVCAGNMGAQNRLNYTVIGSHVNMASRLCYAAGPGEILITEDTYLQPCVQNSIEVEDKGKMSFKGFDEKKQVYKVLRLKEKVADTVLILDEDGGG
jgi:class 3 adenylate cyclase